MGSSANITSVAQIGHFRLALLGFEHNASDALTSVMMQIRRTIEWVEHDQLQYWQMRVKRGHDQVSETRTTLERCQMFAIEGERGGCAVEKKAFEKAKRQVRHAQEKVDVVKKWARNLSHETAEYQASTGLLGGWLESECPKALATLERMMTSLEAYLATDVATMPEPASAAKIPEPGSAAAGSLSVAQPVEPPEAKTEKRADENESEHEEHDGEDTSCA